MTGTLNQAIQPRVVGPLFKKRGSMFRDQSYLDLGLVPLLMWYEGQSPAKRGEAQSRGALAPRPLAMDELKTQYVFLDYFAFAVCCFNNNNCASSWSCVVWIVVLFLGHGYALIV